MLKVAFEKDNNSVLRILCLGAHCDDIEIGCGGSILSLAQWYRKLEVVWIVFSSTGERATEARNCAKLFLKDTAKKKVIIKDFRDGYFPYNGGQIKDQFESLKTEYSPKLVFTHYHRDLHQDHRLISELTWNTFRDHLILEYEVPKYDGDLGSPNFFVPIDESICALKVDYLLKVFKSQREKPWFTSDTFQGIMRLRGIECSSPTRYAEAFYSRKLVLAQSGECIG